MTNTMSHDYRLLMGKISMDLRFAEQFFSSAKSIIEKYTLTPEEKEKLLSLDAAKFNAYRDTLRLKTCFASCDCDDCDKCDGCCNGGEGNGNCSECFASCHG